MYANRSHGAHARLRGAVLAALAISTTVGCLAGPSLAGAATTTTKTFTTAGSYTFTVPQDVARITVTAIGAAGGSSCDLDPGGEGASVTATLTVKPGAKLFVGVGGVGGTSDQTCSSGGVGGTGGGGAGGGVGGQGGVAAAGGGGASGVGLTSLAAGTSPLVVAGGGGGATICGGRGGNAGSPGVSGTSCDTSVGGPGGAGTATAGGAGGASGGLGTAGTSGSAGTGGAGGVSNGPSGSGGGGGGGYYGGGGGGAGGVFSGGGGGGGGSSFVAKRATNVSAATPTTASASVTISYTAQPKPTAITKPATRVKAHSATLHGSVNPEGLKTTYYFQYGKSKAYGKVTAKHTLKADRFSAKAVAAALKNLKPNTTYHFRVVARNASGTARGRDLTFHTPAVSAAFTG